MSSSAQLYQPHLGMLTAGGAVAYGLLVYSLLLVFGSRGPLRSPDLVLLTCGALLLVGSDLLTRMFAALHLRPALVLFMLLLVHCIAGVLRIDPRDGDILVQSHFPEIARWSFLGFVAASGIRARFSLDGLLGRNPARTVALILSITVWGLVLVASLYGARLLRPDTLLLEVLTDQPLYQVFADFYCVAVSIVIAQQVAWFEAAPRQRRQAALFAFVALLQGAISFLLLQIVGSNKGPVLLSLTCLATILSVRVPNAASRRRSRPARSRAVVWATVPMLVILAFAATRLNIRGFRLFEGGDSFPVAGSSVTGRAELTAAHGWEFLTDRPILGNPSLGIADGSYLHSLLSVQTNLGVVGTLLVVGILIAGWRNLRRFPDATLLRITFAPILLTAAVSSFYVWGPLWLLLSALAALPASGVSSRTSVQTSTVFAGESRLPQ